MYFRGHECIIFIIFIFLFFFNDPATTEIYTLSLHDALPIFHGHEQRYQVKAAFDEQGRILGLEDRKSTRLNSSHRTSSYAVFCWKKKKNTGPKGNPYTENRCSYANARSSKTS